MHSCLKPVPRRVGISAKEMSHKGREGSGIVPGFSHYPRYSW